AEATGQSRLPKNSSQSVCPIIDVLDEPSRSGMTNSPVIGMKQSSVPAMMPGSDSGTVTVKNARQGGQPRSAAASSNVGSSRARERIGDGVADQQQQHGRDRRNREALEIGIQIKRVGVDAGVTLG